MNFLSVIKLIQPFCTPDILKDKELNEGLLAILKDIKKCMRYDELESSMIRRYGSSGIDIVKDSMFIEYDFVAKKFIFSFRDVDNNTRAKCYLAQVLDFIEKGTPLTYGLLLDYNLNFKDEKTHIQARIKSVRQILDVLRIPRRRAIDYLWSRLEDLEMRLDKLEYPELFKS